jgi:hypothetical protein
MLFNVIAASPVIPSADREKYALPEENPLKLLPLA